ncbi:YbaL family putative K(+) efflux transporter [Cupriavidus respiraculi]|uniref:Cation/proton antiporter YbaL n=1 Tax=Cupriavidus respiraculi TaxID=195930 RepID=A0ABM8WDK3_9BURK|nr:YbaL family putative K(+) efflux transporter [Cupriavidus respiraculi]MBY4949739.1 Kef family K(+) transporter [Cupriavidus respiraculi]CAG9165414.1 Putative cation/proton antiporter YbaL [Cupriavidus respiraculi]
MPHSISLITTIATALGLALIFGFLCARLKMPALVGYLLAGIAIGPATPGFVGDIALAQQLAEIGVMLLMFGVGLHFSLDDLLSVRRIALPGAIVQIAFATAAGAGLALLWGWPLASAVVFGLCLSVASTVVLLRALERRGLLESVNGRIAVGWLVVEDLVMVLVLVLLPPIAATLGQTEAAATPSEPVWLTLVSTLGRVALFIALMLVVGRRVFPWVLWQVARTGSQELFTLCVVAAAVGIAYGSAEAFGVSFALGAFFSGMVLRGSALSHRAAQESLPLRDAFAVLFFVSVGMLFDPRVLVEAPLHVAATIAIIIVVKSVAAFALVLAMRYPLNTALTVSASLAQIGEFSFILASLGVALNVLPAQGQSLVLAGALISIALNSLVFRAAQAMQGWIHTSPALTRKFERSDDPLSELPASVDQSLLRRQVVLVGFGRVGRRIARALSADGIPYVVADQNRDIVEALRERGIPAVSGDATEPGVLIQAHIAHAGMLVIATSDSVGVRRMVEIARTLNPGVRTVVRTHSEEEARLLAGEKIDRVFLGEEELASNMIRHVVDTIREDQAREREGAVPPLR